MDLNLAVFASGRGSNFGAILEAISRRQLAARVVLLVSDQAAAGALALAQRAGIDTLVLAPQQFSGEQAYTDALLQALREKQANFIVLAGYLRKIPALVVKEFHGRMINIHPALLPSFGGRGLYGARVHQAVLDYGCKVSGVTVHLVDEEYDAGPPILQRCVAVQEDDTAATLAARVLEVEHQLLPETLRLFAEERVEIAGRRVRILPANKR